MTNTTGASPLTHRLSEIIALTKGPYQCRRVRQWTTPERLRALARVAIEADSYFGHHISQSPHGEHAEKVTAALSALSDVLIGGDR